MFAPAGWFYGPEVTLQDCLAFFFSEDELKGDNMYSCEKCEKLRNGLKFSQVSLVTFLFIYLVWESIVESILSKNQYFSFDKIDRFL